MELCWTHVTHINTIDMWHRSIFKKVIKDRKVITYSWRQSTPGMSYYHIYNLHSLNIYMTHSLWYDHMESETSAGGHVLFLFYSALLLRGYVI